MHGLAGEVTLGDAVAAYVAGRGPSTRGPGVDPAAAPAVQGARGRWRRLTLRGRLAAA